MRRAIIQVCVSSAVFLTVVTSAHAQLGVALNATNLTWSTSGTGGASGWFAQSGTTHDGVSAAASGVVATTSQSSTLQTSVTGPGTLTFWWRSDSLYTQLSFVVGTTTQAIIYAAGPTWRQQTIYLGSGAQTLKWIHAPVTSGGVSQSYLDQVSYTPGTTAPIITSQPPDQSQVLGLNATFTSGVAGTPPLVYQWQFNGSNISGATASSLTVTNVQGTNLGYYSVVVTNNAGSTNTADAVLEFGEVTAWGLNAFGEIAVASGMTNVLAITGGEHYSLALRADGALLTWGTNSHGQLNIPGELTNVVAIAAGGAHSLALREDGTVVAWGNNNNGQTNVPAGLTNVVAIAAGGLHNLALKRDGTVVAWGWNTPSGQTNVPADLTNVVAIAAGYQHSLALKGDGSVVAWGANSSGQTSVPANFTNALAIGAGDSHSLALRSDGTVAAWGYRYLGVTNVPAGLTDVVAITASYFHSTALRANGTVVAWGRDFEGQTNSPSGLTNVVAIAGGGWHSVALVGNGPPVQSVTVINPTCTSGVFSLSLPTQCGRVYQFEFKNSLTDTNWTALPLFAGNGRDLLLSDSSPADAQRFYRVRRW